MNGEGYKTIGGVRYHDDRPNDCSFCFFWKNRKVGCTLGKENCYYLAESPEKHSPCEGCGYAPCVSFCMKNVLEKMEAAKHLLMYHRSQVFFPYHLILDRIWLRTGNGFADD